MFSVFLNIEIPLLVRILIPVVSVSLLVYLGRRVQKQIMISANMYFQILSSHKIKEFFIMQLLLPSIIGLLIVVLFKIPHLSNYMYMDIGIMATYFVFIGTTFLHLDSKKSMIFKPLQTPHGDIQYKRCILDYLPVAILWFIMSLIRFSLISAIRF